jgi:hypothetical protein
MYRIAGVVDKYGGILEAMIAEFVMLKGFECVWFCLSDVQNRAIKIIFKFFLMLFLYFYFELFLYVHPPREYLLSIIDTHR